MDYEAGNNRTKFAVSCPKGHEDCHPISELDGDFLPEKCTQGYYCYKCEASYVVTYFPQYKRFLEAPNGHL